MGLILAQVARNSPEIPHLIQVPIHRHTLAHKFIRIGQRHHLFECFHLVSNISAYLEFHAISRVLSGIPLITFTFQFLLLFLVELFLFAASALGVEAITPIIISHDSHGMVASGRPDFFLRVADYHCVLAVASLVQLECELALPLTFISVEPLHFRELDLVAFISAVLDFELALLWVVGEHPASQIAGLPLPVENVQNLINNAMRFAFERRLLPADGGGRTPHFAAAETYVAQVQISIFPFLAVALDAASTVQFIAVVLRLLRPEEVEVRAHHGHFRLHYGPHAAVTHLLEALHSEQVRLFSGRVAAQIG